MARDLDLVVKLLRYLNKKDKAIEAHSVASDLNLSYDELLLCLHKINLLDPDLLAQKDARIILREKLDLLDGNFLYKNSSNQGRVMLSDSLDSTNTMMLNNAANLVNGDVLIAEIQSHGRGRRDRQWHGSIAKQLTMSLAWRFASLDSLTGLSVAMGAKIVQTLQELGFEQISLKWPNDIFMGDLKIAGILVETLRASKVMAIVGLGINVHSGSYLIEGAGALRACLKNLGRNELALSLIDGMRQTMRDFESCNLDKFIPLLKSCDYLKDKEIVIMLNNKESHVIARGIDQEGSLLVEDMTGHSFSLRAGHIIEVVKKSQ